MIELNQKTWELLQRVNSRINNGVKYQSDRKFYDKWQIPFELRGDCEDYAIMKQAALRDLGIESWLALCSTENKSKHAVLIVDTDKGSLVLDNRYYDVRRYEDLKYKWLKIESAGGKWLNILPD